MATQTTTVKLPIELKARIDKLVEGTDQSVHAFMVNAIETQAGVAERYKEFLRAAEESAEEMDRTGLGYPAREVHEYLRAKFRGEKAKRPKARPWRK